MRRDYEVAKATQESRAGRPQRAINLIFGTDGPMMVDGAFWKQQQSTAEDGTAQSDWIYVTDAAEVEAEALRHVSKMFPPPLLWEPYETAAVFPTAALDLGEIMICGLDFPKYFLINSLITHSNF